MTKHVLPRFGSRQLDSITTKEIEGYKITRRRAKVRGHLVSEATVNRELCCLKLIFRKAVEWHDLEVNPSREVKTYKETPEAPRLLESHEIEALLAAASDHIRALVACALFAGLRSEELLHLQWRDINWDKGEILVASRRGSHTKNYENRRIPINSKLIEYLRRHPRVISGNYVFSRGDGRPYKDLRGALRKAASVAGIEGFIGLHQPRHAFCSHALMQGIDARTVQRWIGATRI